MSIVAWIVFGLIVGIIANMIEPGPNRGGILGAMVLGIAGALIGGFLSDLVLGVDVSGFNISSFVVAILGSVILLWLGRVVTRSENREE